MFCQTVQPLESSCVSISHKMTMYLSYRVIYFRVCRTPESELIEKDAMTFVLCATVAQGFNV